MKVRCIKGFSADGKDVFIKDKIYEVYEFENKKLKHRYFIVSELNENFYFDSIEQFNIMFKTQIEEVKEPLINFAELLGFEEGEEFAIVNGNGCTQNGYHFENNVLKNTQQGDCYKTTCKLLNGEYKVVKLPWKPKDREHAYYIILNKRFIGDVTETIYSTENAYDVSLYKCGWLFRTYEEAEANKERILKEYADVLNA